MFHAEGQTLAGDHLDLSFSATERWTRVDPSEGSPPSLWLSLGDAVAGPAVQLGLCPPVPGTFWLDTHYHASDQFRATLRGDFHLQRKHMKTGDFGYQVAGIPYREGLVPGDGEPLWMFAVHGDRRGAPSTITRQDGSFPLGEIGADQLDRPMPSADDPYWNDVPGGAKGIPALAVASGRKVGGFLWGNFAEAANWQALAEGVRANIGLFGDRACGPALLTLRADAGHIAIPAQLCASETILAVVRGSVTIEGRCYSAGDIRVQRAGAPSAAAIAGGEGADLVYMIADRRALPAAGDDATVTQAWLTAVGDACGRLADALKEDALA
ncbi:MAG: hypothetical protein C0489_11185 [Candidatus Accumulibacter sp.]|nr:hypothetical protein [Accumulibacter sp.]